MPGCEMCGKIVDSLVSVKVEATTMNVCSNCTKYGSRVTKKEPSYNNFSMKESSRNRTQTQRVEFEENLVSNYAMLIKQARERMGFKQEDAAKQLSEKSSLLQQIESGHIRPTFVIARKLGNLFGIKLIEKVPVKSDIEISHHESKTLTMGDILMQAMKKKK